MNQREKTPFIEVCSGGLSNPVKNEFSFVSETKLIFKKTNIETKYVTYISYNL